MSKNLVTKIIAAMLIAFLFTAGVDLARQNEVWGYSDKLLPTASPISSSVATFDLDDLYQVADLDLRKGLRLSLISLQGIVNKGTPSIYLYNTFGEPDSGANDDYWMMDYYKTKNWVTVENAYTDVYTMIEDHLGSIQGAVVYDPSKPYTINVATNVAGVENRIMISPGMIADVQAIGVTDIMDLRNNNFTSSYDAYNWVYTNYFHLQSSDAIACAYYSDGTDYQRDYFIQNKIHTFWLPEVYKYRLGDSTHTPYVDSEYSADLYNKICEMMYNAPENIPVLGFWYAVSDAHADPDGYSYEVGVKETKGVGLSSSYGKFTVCTDWGGDFSFHSGVQADMSTISQQRQREKAYREYDPSKKYVAFTMIESGDAPSYYQYGFKYMQWDDSYRSQVPVSYGITPSLYYIMPGLLQGIYESATENSYFFNAISGDGYMYPFPVEAGGTTYQYGLFGTSDMNQIDIINDYYTNVSKSMYALDADMLGNYSHVWPGSWNYSYDDLYINAYITPNVDGLTSIISDMGRLDGMTAANANRWYDDGVSIHNGITRWSTAYGFPPQWDETYDQEMVDYLVNDIQAYSSGGNFMQCMTLSWQYSGRRLKKVMDILEPQGYEFVTLDEFEHLWRQSLNCGLPSKDPFNKYGTKHAGAAVTFSSAYDSDHEGGKAVDNNNSTEWVSAASDKDTAWIQMDWDQAKTVNKVVLRDRADADNQVLSGMLSFSDGSTIEIGQLSNLGIRNNVEFESRDVNWIRFEVTSASNTTTASGLAEMEVYETRMPSYYLDKARNYAGITSSGYYGTGYEQEKAVDGNSATRWASQTSGASWIETTMTGLNHINRVKIDWATQSDYVIKTSVDGLVYNTVAVGTSSVGETSDDVFAGVLAKYVRVETDGYASIWNYEVYNNPQLQQNVSVGKNTSASGVWNNDLTYGESKAVDGDATTYWAAQTTGDSWVEVDLGIKTDVDRVRINWAFGCDYQIQVSDDGKNYVTVKSGESITGQVTDDLLPKMQSRYVRVYSPSYSAIYELDVHRARYTSIVPVEPEQYLDLYLDRFDGNNQSSWSTVNSDWNVINGQYSGVGGVSSYGYSMSGRPSWVNYSVETQMSLKGTASQCAGVAFRVKDQDNHYLLAVYPTQMHIYAVVNGVYSSIASAVIGTVPDTEYDYRIDVVDNGITVYRNEQLLIDAVDGNSYFNTGKIGLFVFDQTEAVFDDVVITNILVD